MLRSKPIVPGVPRLIYVGYKSNARKVLYFIDTEDSVSTNLCIPYLFQYPDPFFYVITFSWTP